jgi:endonuclease YncB( thermonuclease family)
VTNDSTHSGEAPKSKGKKDKPKRENESPVEFRVARVVDGDTLELADGRRVRLVQIDTPELGGGECYSRKAAATLAALTPPGSTVGLSADPALDAVDRYGRLLRYVFRGSLNVNLELVRRGAASVWFYDGDQGHYADKLRASAREARQTRRGAWGACAAELDPLSAFATMPKHNERHDISSVGSACEPGYDPCLPITADLDCADVEALGFALVEVTGSDRYRLDGDGDGIGCE